LTAQKETIAFNEFISSFNYRYQTFPWTSVSGIDGAELGETHSRLEEFYDICNLKVRVVVEGSFAVDYQPKVDFNQWLSDLVIVPKSATLMSHFMGRLGGVFCGPLHLALLGSTPKVHIQYTHDFCVSPSNRYGVHHVNLVS